MSQVNVQPTTTFLLLKSHEPSCPPSITDAGSQAGQAFNQVLRYIAGCPGFQSQLFGWPWEPTSDDIDVNEWMASIMPGSLGIFINWDDDRSATNFLSTSSLLQAFQGLTAFFEVPRAATLNKDQPFDQPFAMSISWKTGDVANILNKTKLPLQVSITAAHDKSLDPTDHEPEDAVDARGFATAQADLDTEISVHIRHVAPATIVTALPPGPNTLVLSLMRTRYCSRIKEDLYDMIRARRVD